MRAGWRFVGLEQLPVYPPAPVHVGCAVIAHHVDGAQVETCRWKPPPWFQPGTFNVFGKEDIETVSCCALAHELEVGPAENMVPFIRSSRKMIGGLR